MSRASYFGWTEEVLLLVKGCAETANEKDIRELELNMPLAIGETMIIRIKS